MSVGDFIRKARIKKGISQQFIADSIGISQSKFNRIENGRSDILLNDLLLICQILKINYIELLQSANPNQLNDFHTKESHLENNETEISQLCNEIKSLKSDLNEMKEYMYSIG